MDIATLGIKLNTQPLKDAAKAFDDAKKAAKGLEEGVKGAGKEAEDAGKKIDKTADVSSAKLKAAGLAGKAIGIGIGAAVTAAVGAIAAIDRLINRVADLQDIAEKTGASAAGFSQMRTAMDVAGTSADSVAGAMTQMTRVLAASNDEAKGAAKALDFIGISIEDFRKLRPDEQFKQLSERLGQYEDGAGKVAIAQAIMGRGAAEMLPLLKELANEQSRNVGLTDEQIAAADDYADANKRLQSQITQLTEGIAMAAMPAMVAFMGAVNEAVTEALGLGTAASDLSKNEGITTFAFNAARALGGIVTAGQAVFRVFSHIVKGLSSLAQAAAAVMAAPLSVEGFKGAYNQIMGIYKGFSTDVRQMWSADSFSTLLEKHIDVAKEKMAKGVDATNNIVKKKSAAGFVTAKEDDGGAGKKAEREAERARKEHLRRMQQLAKEDEKRLKEANEEKEKAQEEHVKFMRAKWLEEYDAYQASIKAQQDADAAVLQDSQDAINAINDRAAAIETEIENYGKLQSAIEQTALVKMEADLASFEGDEQARIQLEKRIAAQQRLVAAMQGQEALQANERNAREAGSAWTKVFDDIGESLTDAIMEGGTNAKQMLERSFRAMILRPTIQGLMTGVAGMMGVGPAAAGNQGGSGGGGLGSLGSIASMGTSLFGAGGIGGAVMAGAGWMTGATTLGGSLAAAGSLIGAGGAGITAGLGMIAGALGPIALGVFALYKMFGKKGGGPKAEGSAGNIQVDGLHGVRGIGTQGNELDKMAADAVQGINSTYQNLARTFGVSGAGVSFGLGLSMDPKGDAPSMVQTTASRHGQAFAQNVNWNVPRSEEDLREAISAQTVDIMIQALQQSGMDQAYLDYFNKISVGLDAEGKAKALESVGAIAQVVTQMNDLGPAFGKVVTMSTAAKISMIELAGGAEQLAANMQTYAQNFFSDEEKRAATIAAISRTLGPTGLGAQVVGALNQAPEQARKTFRSIVDGLDMNTTAGQEAFIALMAVSGAFAELTVEIEKDNHAVEEAMDDLSNAYERQRDSIEETMDRLKDWQDSLAAFRSSLITDEKLSPLNQIDRYAAASMEYERTKAGAKAGDIGAAERFETVARTYLEASQSLYAGSATYQNDFMRVMSDIEGMESVAQMQYNIQKDSLDRLNKIVEGFGISTSAILSVREAIIKLAQARGEPIPAGLNAMPFKSGIARIPFDNFPSMLHKNEAVLNEADASAWRSADSLISELRSLRTEVSSMRKENREDASAVVDATFDAMARLGVTVSTAQIEAARAAVYAQKSKPVLS